MKVHLKGEGEILEGHDPEDQDMPMSCRQAFWLESHENEI